MALRIAEAFNWNPALIDMRRHGGQGKFFTSGESDRDGDGPAGSGPNNRNGNAEVFLIRGIGKFDQLTAIVETLQPDAREAF